jgi:hypothetical protein
VIGFAAERSSDVSEADDPFHAEAGADREMTVRMLAVEGISAVRREKRSSAAAMQRRWSPLKAQTRPAPEAVV